jgi:GT2 family glycosyltransferase
MNTQKKVGVIVPVRNRIERTKRFLAQFQKQSYTNYTLYFVDSESTDGTREWLSSLASDKIKWIGAGDDDYWTGATNKGVNAALKDDCDHILTINDDSIPSTDLLEKLIESANSSNYLIIGSRVNFFENPSLVWSTGSYNLWGTYKLFQLFDNGIEEEKIQSVLGIGHIKPINLMCGNGVLVHRSVFDRVGLYDEVNCPHYHADSEFVMRASARGIACGISYDAVVYNDTTGYRASNGYTPPKDPPWSGESWRYVGATIRWLKKVDRLFIKKRSEKRIATVSYIIRNFAPRGSIIKTHVNYFGFFFGAYLIHPTIKRKWRKSASWVKKTLASDAVFDIVHYESRRLIHRGFRKIHAAILGKSKDYPLH